MPTQKLSYVPMSYDAIQRGIFLTCSTWCTGTFLLGSPKNSALSQEGLNSCSLSHG